MATRVLYLHFQHSGVAGHTATAGTQMVKGLRDRFDQVVVMHWIVKDEMLLENSSQLFLEDTIGISEVSDSGFNAIYCEGGPYSDFSNDESGGRAWKFPKGYAEQFVRQGNILIVPDINRNFAAGPDAVEFGRFAGLDFEYGEDDYTPKPIYFIDTARNEDFSDTFLIRLDTATMRSHTTDWLQPSFDQLSQLLVSGPLEIRADQDELAFASSPSVGTLCNDLWWAPPFTTPDLFRLRYHPNGPQSPGLSGPFASVRQLGLGFVVAITGWISSDRIVNSCPDNVRWISNLIDLLRQTISTNAERAAFHTYRGVRLFLSHRSLDNAIVHAVGEALKKKGREYGWIRSRFYLLIRLA